MKGLQKFKEANNFGVKGWIVVLISMNYWLLGTSLVNDGLNTLQPVFSEMFGCTTTQLALFATIGGWVSILGLILFGRLAAKLGARICIIISCIGMIGGSLLLGYSTSPAMYGAAIILYYVAGTGTSGIGVNVLGADWFPKKKGMFMGISTMGITIGAAAINQVLSNVIAKSGLHVMFIGYSVYIVIVIVLTLIFVRNTPEEAGAYPDNDKTMTREQVIAIREAAESLKKSSEWTVGKVLKTKNTWFITIGWGLVMCCATGILTQSVPMLISHGHSATFGIWLLTVLFPFGFLFSYLGGLVDNRWGTKAGAWFSAGLMCLGAILILLFGSNVIAAGAGMALFMGSVSSGNNMTMSIVTSCWGRYDFANAWQVISITTTIIRSAGIVLVSLVAEKTGNYNLVFILMIVAAVISGIFVFLTDDTLVGRTDEDILKARANMNVAKEA